MDTCKSLLRTRKKSQQVAMDTCKSLLEQEKSLNR